MQAYKKKANDSEFFVFDENAQLIKQVFLPDESRYKVKMNPDVTFTIKNNRYYYLVENLDNGDWELHMKPIEAGQGCVKVLKNLTHSWKSEIVKHEARNSKQIRMTEI